jgi:hypothetical protein
MAKAIPRISSSSRNALRERVLAEQEAVLPLRWFPIEIC